MKLQVDFAGKSEDEIAKELTRGTGRPWQPRDWTPVQEIKKEENERSC